MPICHPDTWWKLFYFMPISHTHLLFKVLYPNLSPPPITIDLYVCWCYITHISPPLVSMTLDLLIVFSSNTLLNAKDFIKLTSTPNESSLWTSCLWWDYVSLQINVVFLISLLRVPRHPMWPNTYLTTFPHPIPFVIHQPLTLLTFRPNALACWLFCPWYNMLQTVLTHLHPFRLRPFPFWCHISRASAPRLTCEQTSLPPITSSIYL